jgi:hypothetical protein
MMMKNTTQAMIVLVFLILGVAMPIVGQTSTWAGGPGVWSDKANWCPAAVPTNGSDIVVGNCNTGSPSAVAVDITPNINNLTIGGGNSVTVSAGKRLTISGSSVSNSGTLGLAGTGSTGAQMQFAGTTVTLSGGGKFLASDAPNLVLGNTATTLINQQTIQGSLALGFEGNFNFNNQGLVDAQGTNPLSIRTTFGTMLNTGTLQASSGGTLQLILGTSGLKLNNSGGTIQALTGSTVQVKGLPISGGTLTTVGSGLILGLGGSIADLTNSGTFQIGGVAGIGSANERLTGTITNTGTIRIGSASWGDDVTSVDGTATLTGGGTLNFVNSIESLGGGNSSPVLNNMNNTINGTGLLGGVQVLNLNNHGVIDANASTPLTVQATIANPGTMQASNGGELRIQGNVDNTGGTIKALDASTVTLNSAGATKGGTFATSGSGVIQAAPVNPTIDGVTNTGLFLIPNTGQAVLLNTITNSGTIFLDSTGGSTALRIGNAVTFAGHGTVMMSDSASNLMVPQSGTSAISNFDNLIEGAGPIGVPFTNQKKGIVLANLVNPLKFTTTVTNLGKFQVNAGSLLQIPANTFTNFANNTLTGGTYVVGGTFAFSSANIVTNAAIIQLTSPTGQIVNFGNNANALTNFATNAKKGQLTVTGKAVLTTTPNFTTSGKVTVANQSKFTVGGSYTQTLGTTKVDGTLTAAAGLSLQGGGLFGKGTVAAVVTSTASVTAGDSATASGKLSINGTYTQQATGSLNIQIGGTAVGSKYSQLAVSNGASLNGILNVKLIKNFLPAIGDKFQVLTSSARTGQFATANGLSINSGEHFQINYTSTGVELEVVSGP